MKLNVYPKNYFREIREQKYVVLERKAFEKIKLYLWFTLACAVLSFGMTMFTVFTGR